MTTSRLGKTLGKTKFLISSQRLKRNLVGTILRANSGVPFPVEFRYSVGETLIDRGKVRTRTMLSNQATQPSQAAVEFPTHQGAKLRILLVDDHAIVRVGLKQMLADAFEQLEVTEVGTGQEALAKVQEASWDLVILDINLPDTNGLDILKKLKTLHTALPVVVLSFHPEEQYAVRALKSGASAYVTKDTAPQELATAIKTVMGGRQYVTATLAERLEAMPLHAAGKPLHTLLSDRELQVLSMIGGGKSVTEIAAALDLSVKTVSTYRMRLLSKLQLKTTSALIRYALTHHL